jgi:hypothetical protein
MTPGGYSGKVRVLAERTRRRLSIVGLGDLARKASCTHGDRAPIRTTATPLVPSSPISKSSRGLRFAAFTATRVIATSQGILQGLDAEGSFHRDRQPPRQNPAGRSIEHDSEINETPLHGDIGDGVAGVALIPAPVEVLGHRPELDDQVQRGPSGSTSPRFSRESRTRVGSSSPMTPGVRPADEAAPVW